MVCRYCTHRSSYHRRWIGTEWRLKDSGGGFELKIKKLCQVVWQNIPLLTAAPLSLSMLRATHPILLHRTTTRTMPSILAKVQDTATSFLFGSDSGTEKTSFYDCVDKDMNGNEVKMDSFKGDVLCVVNVASKWGLTKANYGKRLLFDVSVYMSVYMWCVLQFIDLTNCILLNECQ